MDKAVQALMRLQNRYFSLRTRELERNRAFPVCSVYDRALDYYIELESTLSQF